jgi:hypothetical protein
LTATKCKKAYHTIKHRKDAKKQPVGKSFLRLRFCLAKCKKNAKQSFLSVSGRACSAVSPTFLLIAIKVNVKNLRGLEGEEKKRAKKQNC